MVKRRDSSSNQVSTTTSTTSTSSTAVSAANTVATIPNNGLPPTSNTATTSSSTTSPPAPAKTNTKATKSEITTGEVAGVGVGCVIAGAFLAFLVFCIFMKRSRRSGGGRRRHSREIDAEKSFQNPGPVNLEENLLERADDSQIRKSMQDLNELIDQHVENYYHLQFVDGNQANLERGLVECGYGNDLSPQQMISLLENPKTRFAAIRQFIATVILRNGDCKAKAELSLLPQIAPFCQAIPPIERQAGCDEVFDKAFTKWRHLSAFLLSSTRASRDSPKANERDLQGPIARNVALINSVLKPFIKPDSEMQRYQEDNLSAIIFEGAQLGLLLFCQPSVWVFGWNAGGRETDGAREKGSSHVTTMDMSNGRIGTANTLTAFPGIGERVERHGRYRVREVAAPVVVGF